jgi:hypothetical protein
MATTQTFCDSRLIRTVRHGTRVMQNAFLLGEEDRLAVGGARATHALP